MTSHDTHRAALEVLDDLRNALTPIFLLIDEARAPDATPATGPLAEAIADSMAARTRAHALIGELRGAIAAPCDRRVMYAAGRLAQLLTYERDVTDLAKDPHASQVVADQIERSRRILDAALIAWRRRELDEAKPPSPLRRLVAAIDPWGFAEGMAGAAWDQLVRRARGAR